MGQLAIEYRVIRLLLPVFGKITDYFVHLLILIGL